MVYEQAERRPARDRLEAERAGTGEEIDDARAFERQARNAMREDVEQTLAHAVGGRAQAFVLRGGDRAPAQGSADDPHAPPSGRRMPVALALGLLHLIARRVEVEFQRQSRAKLVGDDAPFHGLHHAGLEIEQLEGTIGDADQPVHLHP